jgi:selenocysteine-specific elongation factor
VAVEGKHLRLASHRVDLSEQDQAALGTIEAIFRDGVFSTPTPAEALEQAGAAGERGQRLFRLLRDQGRLVEIGPDLVLHADHVAMARDRIVATCEAQGHLESAKFRDLVGTTRKYAIPLLEHFDRTGLTVRVDNKRTLRQHHHATKVQGDA